MYHIHVNFKFLMLQKKILSTLIETQLLSALIETKSFQNSFHVCCYYNRIYHKKIKYFVTKIVQIFFNYLHQHIMKYDILFGFFFFRFLMHLTISI